MVVDPSVSLTVICAPMILPPMNQFPMLVMVTCRTPMSAMTSELWTATVAIRVALLVLVDGGGLGSGRRFGSRRAEVGLQ